MTIVCRMYLLVICRSVTQSCHDCENDDMVVATTLTMWSVATSSPEPLTLSTLNLHILHTETSTVNPQINEQGVQALALRMHLVRHDP